MVSLLSFSAYSRGFRGKVRFKTAIYFQFGDWDLYPVGIGW